MKHETAGDPISGLKWTRKTPKKIAEHLKSLNITVSRRTVARLLKDMRYSLRVNRKKLESGNRNPPTPEARNQQFEYISEQREAFESRGCPIASVDTKKKELIGKFKNNGVSWEQEPPLVNDHDFRSDATGIAVPYGVYDPMANFGFVGLGTSFETPAFVVDVIELWWKLYGYNMYPGAKEVLLLADCGGGNGYRARAFKYRLQYQLCNLYGLSVTVCHYPPGASKWNPIEHRLFSEISKNWAGKPLETYETASKYIRSTKTDGGLHVRCRQVARQYEKGETISVEEMETLRLTHHDTLPDWNYTLKPGKI
jgi:hypothetical protein|tara:strand:- start:102 stop:1034 length:933 start_codon:yes stop_codon:yes gene_type:complete